MNFNQTLNEAPENLSELELRKWNVEQLKLWSQLKEKYTFKEFAEKFDKLFRSTFQKTKTLPSISKMIQMF